MPLVEVPVHLNTAPDDRREWTLSLIAALRRYAAQEMNYADGIPVVRWQNADEILIVVDVAGLKPAGQSSSFLAAGRKVVTSALVDLGMSIKDAHVRDEGIKALQRPQDEI